MSSWLCVGKGCSENEVRRAFGKIGVKPKHVHTLASTTMSSGCVDYAKTVLNHTAHDFIKGSLKSQIKKIPTVLENVDAVLALWDASSGLVEEVIDQALQNEKPIWVVVLDKQFGKMVGVQFEFDDF